MSFPCRVQISLIRLTDFLLAYGKRLLWFVLLNMFLHQVFLGDCIGIFFWSFFCETFLSCPIQMLCNLPLAMSSSCILTFLSYVSCFLCWKSQNMSRLNVFWGFFSHIFHYFLLSCSHVGFCFICKQPFKKQQKRRIQRKLLVVFRQHLHTPSSSVISTEGPNSSHLTRISFWQWQRLHSVPNTSSPPRFTLSEHCWAKQYYGKFTLTHSFTVVIRSCAIW